MAVIRSGAATGGHKLGSADGADPGHDGLPEGEGPGGPVGIRERLDALIESDRVQIGITVLIIFNAIILGLETSESVTDSIGGVLSAIDKAIIVVFVIEIATKLVAGGFRFFRSGWNVFDFFVVAVALVPSTGPFAVLRALRVLRVMRLLSQVGQLRRIVESLLRALPGMGWTTLLLGLIFYVYAVMGAELFGEEFPDLFGGVDGSLFSLFQVMTLESWATGVARPVMAEFQFAWIYFVTFIALASFMILNLFIAIIVSATQSWHDDQEDRQREEMKAELAEIKAMLAKLTDGEPTASADETQLPGMAAEPPDGVPRK